MMSRWKIRFRLQVWTVIGAAAVLLAVVGWGYYSAREAAIRETRERALFVAESASAMLDGSLLQISGFIEGVADSLAGIGLSISLEQLRSMQKQMVVKNPEVFGVCLALMPEEALPAGWTGRAPYTFREADGKIGFCDLSDGGTDYTKEDWFRLVQERGEAVWTRPLWWEGVLMVTYSHPIWVGEQGAKRLAGVATCDLTLDWLQVRLEALPTGADGYAVLMDRTGLFVSHPNRELVLHKTIFDVAEERGTPYLEEIGRRMVAGEKGIEEHTGYATARPAWVAYLPLTSTNWIFAAVVSRDGLRQKLDRLFCDQLLLGSLGLVALATMLAFIARSITFPIEKLCAASADLAAGNLETRVPAQQGGDEISELARCMEVMRSEILRQMNDLAESTASRERMMSELRIAHDIQMSLVPAKFDPLPQFPRLDLFAALRPARQVGGDFYDYFLTPSGELVVLVADVSDKGVGAALYMAAARSLLRSFFRAETHREAQAVLKKINEELAPNNPKSMFVTLFCGVLDLDQRTFRFSNAGHNPPLLLSPDGTPEWIEEARSAPVGMFPTTRYGSSERVFVGGEYLVLYTDGITEAEDKQSEFFGEDALEKVVREAAAQGASCEEMVAAILVAVENFTREAPVSDDQTLLVMKISAPPAPAEKASMELVWEAEFAKSPPQVEAALDELEEALGARGAGGETIYMTRLALEELGTNACKADLSGEGTIRVRVFLGADARIEIHDDGAAFDPLVDAPSPDLDAPLADRRVGGVGLHLLRSLAVEFDYRRRDGWNCTSLTFREGEGGRA